LRESLARVNSQMPFHRVHAMLHLLKVAANREEAQKLAESCVATAKSNLDIVGDLLLARALSELAILQWESGARDAAFRSLANALEHFEMSNEEGDAWRAAIVPFGHICGYY